MNKHLILFSLIILSLGCSHNKLSSPKSGVEVDFESVAIQDSTIKYAHFADKDNEDKINELQKSMLYLEEKTEQLEEQLAFYTNRFESLIDIISANSKNISSIMEWQDTASSSIQEKQSLTMMAPDILYAHARDYYIKRNYSKAQSKFKEFINRYPNHELVINCRYWLAEIDYDEGRFTEAISKFQEISINYAGSEKGIDSLFKIALINKRLSNYDLALSQAKSINDNFSDYIRIDKVKAFIKEFK